MVKIFCKNTGTFKYFEEGTPLLDMVDEFDFPKQYQILSAKVNNVSEGLKYRAYKNRDVEFLDYTSYSGRRVYSRSLCFLLSKSARDIFPGCRIVMRRPISKGYFCSLTKPDKTAVSVEDIDRIRTRMQEIVSKDLPFHRYEVRSSEAIDLFKGLGYNDKVKLLESTGEAYVKYYTLEDSADYYYDALLPSTGYLNVWNLEPYRGGMLLRIPNRHKPNELAPFLEQPKTFEVFSENLRWNFIMGLENVGDVNQACKEGKASDLIQIAEALQDRKIVQIAEEIDRRSRDGGEVKIVLITGPSSSGKSTFCKKLSIQLMACGIHPISFSTDDYFVNRVDTPKLPDGTYYFDNFDTVDHDTLQADVLKLLKGETVQVPEFNFVTGIREYNGKTLELTPGTVLLIEGIHALNPNLTNLIPDKNKFKIFINTVTSIALDDHNCIPTSDNRLLRRIIRDANKGAFTALETIKNWPNVRREEVKWIYPYQENADVIFNSAYLLEFAVLRAHAEQILRTVPKCVPEYSEAHRLLKFLNYFTPVSDKDVPPTSIMRSVINGNKI